MCATIMALGHAQLGSDLDKHVVKCAHTSSARIALTPIMVSGRRLGVFANLAVAPPTQSAFRALFVRCFASNRPRPIGIP